MQLWWLDCEIESCGEVKKTHQSAPWRLQVRPGQMQQGDDGILQRFHGLHEVGGQGQVRQVSRGSVHWDTLEPGTTQEVF